MNIQSQHNFSVSQHKAFLAGYEAKLEEIKEMGFNAARDKFNMDVPVGVPFKGSMEAYAYAQGEHEALLKNI